MPRILGLEEQRQALANIQVLLKEIQVINAFLEEENVPGIYEISFTINNPAANEMISGVEENEMGEETGTGEKKSKRVPKTLKYTAPFLCDDNDVVRHYVLLSKKEKVNKIRDLSSTYNIFLDEEEEDILKMFSEEMQR